MTPPQQPQDEHAPSLWRNPDFLRLWTGETISVFGSVITTIALYITAIEVLDASPFDIALMLIARTLPSVIFGLVGGMWVDRLPRRQLLVWMNISRAVIVGSIPIASLLGILSMPHLHAVNALMTATGTLSRPAYTAFLPAIVGARRLLEGNAKLEMSFAASATIGPVIGGILVQLLTAPIAIGLDAVSYLVAAAFLLRIRAPEAPVVAGERRGAVSEIRAGIALVRRDGALRAMTIAFALWALFGFLVTTNYALLLEQLFDADTSTVFGLLNGVGGVGFLVGAFLVSRASRRLGTARTLFLGAALVALSTVFLPLAVPPIIVAFVGLAAASFIGAVGDVLAHVQFRTILQTVTPNRFIGRVEGTQHVLHGVAGLAGALLGGVLGSSVGIRPTMWIAVAISLVFVAVIGRFALRFQRQTTAEVGQVPPS